MRRTATAEAVAAFALINTFSLQIVRRSARDLTQKACTELYRISIVFLGLVCASICYARHNRPHRHACCSVDAVSVKDKDTSIRREVAALHEDLPLSLATGPQITISSNPSWHLSWSVVRPNRYTRGGPPKHTHTQTQDIIIIIVIGHNHRSKR